MNNYLAIDLGAESGRLIMGTFQDGRLSMKEVHRFANSMLFMQGKYFWNIGQLYKEILQGLEHCISVEKIIPESIGIDTWGVDYGLLTIGGSLLGLPYTYRDLRTQNAIQEFGRLLSPRDLYQLTGILLAPYNTIFQLYASKKYDPELINSASDLLFMPDLIAYLLTGKKMTESCFASTSQLYNPVRKDWEKSLFRLLNMPIEIMQHVEEPGSVIGKLSESICRETGMPDIPVIAVATHDTNSAIAAIPALEENWAFISSGTWSVMGFESISPVITDYSFSMNFTNERGVENTFDVMKNHMGLWLLQECRRNWKDFDYEYGQMTGMASIEKPFFAFIDIDDIRFLNPDDMVGAITGYLEETDQPVPESHGQLIRIILESLALKYRQTLDQINVLKGTPVECIYLTGGGIQNELLCQFTANATGVVVRTGLAEGTAAGNIMTQAMAMGRVGSLKEIREVIDRSCKIKTYVPEQTERWSAAYDSYCLKTLNTDKTHIQTN